MRVLIAADSFKGSLDAAAACAAIARGVRRADPRAEIDSCPLADGGEGTASVIRIVLGGEWIDAEVTGPLPQQRVRAAYLWIAGERPSAVIDLAAASGLTLLARDRLDPLRATTYGTGELVRAAIERGAHRVWLALGGSATVDGAVGLAMALGWRLLDRPASRSASAAASSSGSRPSSRLRGTPERACWPCATSKIHCSASGARLACSGRRRERHRRWWSDSSAVSSASQPLSSTAWASTCEASSVEARPAEPELARSRSWARSSRPARGWSCDCRTSTRGCAAPTSSSPARAGWTPNRSTARWFRRWRKRQHGAACRSRHWPDAWLLDEAVAAANGIGAMEAAASSDVPDAEALARAEPLLEEAAARLMNKLVDDHRRAR